MLNRAHLNKYLRLPVESNISVFDFEKQILPDWHNGKLPAEGIPVPVMYRHNHEELELLHVTEGSMDAAIDGTSFTMEAGDIMIDNPFAMHEGCILRPNRFANDHIIIDLRFFGDCCGKIAASQLSGVLSGSMVFPSHIRADDPGADTLAKIIREICLANLECADSPNPSAADCRMTAKICELFSILLIYFPPVPAAKKHRRDVEFIDKIAKYINSSYASELSTASVCAEFGYNISYFCKRFKDSFGMTFTEYLNAYRIHIAAGKYRYSALPLSEIAAQVGFTDYCYFSRVFRRRMGMSPTEFYGR